MTSGSTATEATQPLSATAMEDLRALSSSAICDAIEHFDLRPRSAGFMLPEIRPLVAAASSAIVGYACTSVVQSSTPPESCVVDGEYSVDAFREYSTMSTFRYFEEALKVPGPRIAVVESRDEIGRPSGAWLGEVIATLHKSLGFVGAVTSGGIRDLPGIAAAGLSVFGCHVLVSHSYVHHVESGGPVTVGGLVVRPGDLLHADSEGVVAIPREIATDVVRRAREIEHHERAAMSGFKNAAGDLDRVREVWAELRKHFVA